ncbi:carbohydrate-binding domain-containing protein [Alloprevotella tannerae]|uniref:Carbohydrate-binding domain-containing protein n=1 Tax=Alloprevotella tannerae TaxID=76122 RepID=A0A929RXF5_9BACT|nr:carbohydrate-binding domain-containing protein [Alloprevotella tannerae]MBF0969592.1 carbohydrate-binding domain-containing protein [Alloprevotella tannerae]
MKNQLHSGCRQTAVTAFAALLISLFSLAQEAKAQTKYGFAIAGTWVTSENCNDLTVIPGVEGKVRYDENTKTLFLKDAKIDGKGANAIYSELDGLTVRVAGKNEVRSDYMSAIQFFQPMIIAGSGTLDVTCTGGDAIYANCTSLTIDACTLNAKGMNYGIVGEDGKNEEKLTIKYATVTAEGKRDGSIGCFQYLTLMGCKITTPKGAEFSDDLRGVAIDGALVKEKIVIKPTTFQLWVAGKIVTLDNCADLTTIPGVEGTVNFDPETRVLTLDNASINTDKHYGILNFMNDVTIKISGTNTIHAQQNNAIYNNDDCSLSVVGPNAHLILKGGLVSKDKAGRQAFQNHGTVTISECDMEASAGINALSFGEWKFDRCNVRAKADGDEKYPFAGSMAYLAKIPEFTGCVLSGEAGVHWLEFSDEYGVNYTLVDAAEKPITDWVTITTDLSGIGSTTVQTPTAAQGIYTISGVRLSDSVSQLPKGLYIVNGKKVVVSK